MLVKVETEPGSSPWAFLSFQQITTDAEADAWEPHSENQVRTLLCHYGCGSWDLKPHPGRDFVVFCGGVVWEEPPPPPVTMAPQGMKSRPFRARWIQTQIIALLFTSYKASSRLLVLSGFSLFFCEILIEGWWCYSVEELWLSVLQLAYKKIHNVSTEVTNNQSIQCIFFRVVWPVWYYYQ